MLRLVLCMVLLMGYHGLVEGQNNWDFLILVQQWGPSFCEIWVSESKKFFFPSSK